MMTQITVTQYHTFDFRRMIYWLYSYNKFLHLPKIYRLRRRDSGAAVTCGGSAFQQPTCNFFLLLILLLLISPPAEGRRSSLPKHALERASVEAAQQTDCRSDNLHPDWQTDRQMRLITLSRCQATPTPAVNWELQTELETVSDRAKQA